MFARPDLPGHAARRQHADPGDQRGVPDIALQASSRTGALVYLTLPPDGSSGLICRRRPVQHRLVRHRRHVAVARPQWAGLVAIADQINGQRTRPDQPGAVHAGADPATYANDFFDVTTGNNQPIRDVPGFPATTGWDPVTGLGTPNAASLLPALAAAAG